MSRIDYDSLTILAAVVREGSFEAAAKAMKVTQSAVSQRIRQLEEKAGVVLVARGRPCVPTAAGIQFCRHVEQVTLLQQELADRMRALVGGDNVGAATIRLGVNNDSLATWFPNLIKRASEEMRAQSVIIARDSQVIAERARAEVAVAMANSRQAMLRGADEMERGAIEMRNGAAKMREEARKLRDPAYRAKVIAEARENAGKWNSSKWNYKIPTDQELIDAIPKMEEGARKMDAGVENMRQGARRMRESAQRH